MWYAYKIEGIERDQEDDDAQKLRKKFFEEVTKKKLEKCVILTYCNISFIENFKIAKSHYQHSVNKYQYKRFYDQVCLVQ